MDEFDTLESLGYTKFQVVAQVKHKGGEFRDRLGGRVNHEFEAEATGPFGEHLRGPWLTRKAAIRRYVPIFLLYKTLGDNTIGRRLARRIPFVRNLLRHVLWYDTHAMRDGSVADNLSPAK